MANRKSSRRIYYISDPGHEATSVKTKCDFSVEIAVGDHIHLAGRSTKPQKTAVSARLVLKIYSEKSVLRPAVKQMNSVVPFLEVPPHFGTGLNFNTAYPTSTLR
jgi:hypothetical protein